MPTIKYLGVEIDVRPGTASSGEVAHATIDGERRCFLGGESEARRFLRERRWGHVYGPRQATWEVLLLDSGSSTTVYSGARARETEAYFVGRRVRTTRVEHCPVPGCDGHGEITEPGGRRRFVTHRPCPRHVLAIAVIELEGAVPEEREEPNPDALRRAS